jgi:voltage-gated potassium channel Kch
MTSPKRQISTSDKLRYAFDRSMAAGPIALIGWLALVSLAFIGLAAVVLTLTGIKPADGEKLPFAEAAWQSAMRAIDAGALGGDSGWSYRGVMLLVTIGGIFIVSSLIGVLTSGLESKMDETRKGRSFVIESDHTLILGWSSNVFTIISELVIANENQKAPRIVIMADKDKVEMEEEIRSKVGPTGKTRVICRTGSPIDLYDLEIANPHESKSIIILSPDDDDPDSQVIKSVLAITNNPRRREEPYHIVAEIQDPKNMEAAHLVGRDEAQFIQSNDLIARITVQTCRQSGMSVIYTELLDYGGDEIYFKEEAGLVGKTFGDALRSYEDSALLGMQFRDGRVQVNPPMDTLIAAGDKVIAISADDDTIQLSGKSDFGIDSALIQQSRNTPAKPERTLILGWNSRGTAIINELDSYVAPGSGVTVVSEIPEAEAEIARLCTPLLNLGVSVQNGVTSDRATLDSLQIPTFQHVIVLGYTEVMQPQQADARTLITLLHLRNIEQKSGVPLSIVSEMLDVGNRELAEVTQADDFIVSDNLISLLMVQVSENKHLNAVFNDLFDSEGSEIYLKPVSDYVTPGQPLNFYTVVEAARQRGECAIGYRQLAHATNSEKQYGVVVNPKKSESLRFSEEDRIIVVAES